MSAFRAQLRHELVTLAHNGEQLLLTLIIPIILLAFFSTVDVLPAGAQEPLDFLTPGVLALAVMSAAMVSLGIGVGFERSYRVLKRLAVTPLGRGRLVAAKIATVLAVEIVQFVLLILVAFALGWNPSRPSWLSAIAATALGTLAFAGIGISLAGRLRAEINLAAQNGLYLLLLLLGGMIIPFAELPAGLREVAKVLPSGALADVLRDTLTGGGVQPQRSWIVLAAWAVATPLAAIRLFRWE